MRPGQSCPGVGWRGSATAGWTASFNEAGAIMPRSGGIVPEVVLDSRLCFNEAGAIMPRSGPPPSMGRSRAEGALQ